MTDLPTDAPAADPHLADAADVELRCPLCDYDLRGLPDNRCPECGYAFDPDQLRAAKVERLPWLFEHGKPRRLAIAFVATTVRSLFPFAFWREVAAAHVIERRRLTLWACLWHGIAIVMIATLLSSQTYLNRTVALFGYSGPFPPRAPFVTQRPLADAFGHAIESEAFQAGGGAIGVVMLWPTLSMLAILLFGQTLQRAGVDRGHLLRCTRYAIPSVFLPVLTAVLLVTLGPWNPLGGGAGIDASLIALAILVSIVTATLQMSFAYARYLRLPQAVITAFLVQTVVWLSYMAGGALIEQATRK